MVKIVECRKSQKGNLYLCLKENGKFILVNLIKDRKRFKPELVEGEFYKFEFSSFANDKEKNIVAYFGVDNFESLNTIK